MRYYSSHSSVVVCRRQVLLLCYPIIVFGIAFQFIFDCEIGVATAENELLKDETNQHETLSHKLGNV